MFAVSLIAIAVMIVVAVIKGMVKEAIKVGASFVVLTSITAWSRHYYSTKGTFVTDLDGSRVIEVSNTTMIVMAVITAVIGAVCIGVFLRGKSKLMSTATAIITSLMFLATLTSGTELFVPTFKPLGLILAVCVFLVCGGTKTLSSKG